MLVLYYNKCNVHTTSDSLYFQQFEHLDLCNTLWCAQASEPMLCKTKRGPPLPGTECGHNKVSSSNVQICKAVVKDKEYAFNLETF